MKKVLIGTTIKEDPRILELYLLSLQDLKIKNVEINYCFIDDNDNPNSSQILSRFAASNKAEILKSSSIELKNPQKHAWTEEVIWKVAKYKNKIIEKAIEGNYDYLFFVDSDLVLQRETLEHLISLDKEIVSEIFWTKWKEDGVELPQVWLQDKYTLYQQSRNEALDNNEINKRIHDFLNMLRKPGVYEVGGLGALTLIKKEVLQSGVNFDEIKNVSFPGEDRHFCIRAAVHGYSLFVDTHYPAFHIYRESDLKQFFG